MSENIRIESATIKSKSAGTGRFARMFNLPRQGADVDDGTLVGWLTTLGQALTDDVDQNGAPFPAGDHPALPAGYTYLGQFIDHDLTLDPTKLPTERIDIATLNNFRSPALDLDSLLGFGPGTDHFLYEKAHTALEGRLRTAQSLAGNPDVVSNDLPRFADGVPLIGDPRNDENLFVGQLHTAFITFYNKVLADLTAGTIADVGPADGSLAEKAARLTRWHYQWIVLRDFLPRIVETDKLEYTIQNGPQFYIVNAGEPAYMPVEFAGAAYRLGHSMVRERYRVNGNFTNQPLSDIFDFSSSGGNVPVPNSWFVNWSRLFEIDANTAVNHARRLDPYVAPQLHDLPGVPAPTSLVVRNLLRGWSWGLPSGQAIATHIGVPVLPPDRILADAGGQLSKESAIVQGFNFHTDTPLWYYIIKEAEALHAGERLGPLGSTLLAEVFVGLLRADTESFLSMNPGWSPTLPAETAGQFTMADLFRYLPAGAINPNGGDTGPL